VVWRPDAQVVGYLDQRTQRDAIERDGVPASQSIQVNAVTVKGRNDREAGEATLRRLRLLNDRQFAA